MDDDVCKYYIRSSAILGAEKLSLQTYCLCFFGLCKNVGYNIVTGEWRSWCQEQGKTLFAGSPSDKVFIYEDKEERSSSDKVFIYEDKEEGSSLDKVFIYIDNEEGSQKACVGGEHLLVLSLKF